jgi:DNA-cytosine methyltransferase
MKMLELFAGINGFGLAAEWMGWETVATVEINPQCNETISKNFPNALRFEDIKNFRYADYVQLCKKSGHDPRIDIICGGFPCQPFSVAGKREGEKDERFLWAHFNRIISEAKPMVVVAENVSGLVTISDGLVYGCIIDDLESQGYEVQPFIIPACAVGAPHRRDRVWIVAYAESARNKRDTGNIFETQRGQDGELLSEPIHADSCYATHPHSKRQLQPKGNVGEIGRRAGNGNQDATHPHSLERQLLCGSLTQPKIEGDSHNIARTCPTTHPDGIGCESGQISKSGQHCFDDTATDTDPRSEGLQGREGQRGHTMPTRLSARTGEQWEQNWFEVANLFCRVDDGLPDWMDIARLRHDIKSVYGETFTDQEIERVLQKIANHYRIEGLKQLGNSIVPQVAYQIFQAINTALYCTEKK